MKLCILVKHEMSKSLNKTKFQIILGKYAIQNFVSFSRNSLTNVKELFLGIPRNEKIKWKNFRFFDGSSEIKEVKSSNFAHNIFRTFPSTHLNILSKFIDFMVLENLEIFSSAVSKMVVIIFYVPYIQRNRLVTIRPSYDISKRF